MLTRWLAVGAACVLLDGCALYQLNHIEKKDKTEKEWTEVQKPAPASREAPPAK